LNGISISTFSEEDVIESSDVGLVLVFVFTILNIVII
jgi:hypothetical protein